MTIKVNRFEVKEINRTATVKVENPNTLMIKDHETDKVISFIQLTNDKKKNREIANRIITTIEDWILEQEDATSNQD